jgi:phosphoribosylaminoimidazole-succinocarboxamide synthase
VAAIVTETHLEGLPVRRGKVRDVYDLGDRLLIVATDRISAYDVIMPTPIPDKGRLLTGLSLWWFDFLADITPNHLITADVAKMPPAVKAHADILRGRSMLCRKAKVFPVECVVRGYLAGSGWKEYQASGTVCGAKLPPGLKQCSPLPEPIFTPSTKAEAGHDENISFEQSCDAIGREAATTLRDRSIAVYRKAAEYARTRGIIIADTKFEWGSADGRIILVDEVLTPDSSRFWRLRAGPRSAQLRQAVPPELARHAERLEPDASRAGPARRHRHRHAGKVRRGLRADDGQEVRVTPVFSSFEPAAGSLSV